MAIALPAGLPPLTGWPRRLFWAVWGLMLLGALIAVGVSAPQLFVLRPQPDQMLGLQLSYDSPRTIQYAMGGEAERAGIRAGDRIVAIDGQPAAADIDMLLTQLAGPAGSAANIDIASEGRTARLRLTRSKAHRNEAMAAAGLSPTTWLLLSRFVIYSGILLLFGCAILLMLRRSRDPLAPWASLTALTIILGNGAIANWLRTQGPIGEQLVGGFNFLAFALLISVLALFPDGRFKPRGTLAFVVTTWVLMALTQDWDVRFGNLMMNALQIAAVAFVIWRYRAMDETGRQQIRWILFGFAASILSMALFIAGQFAMARTQSLGGDLSLILALNVLSLLIDGLILGGITIALLRYRLYDADIAISRSVAYGVLTVGLLAIFAGSEKIIEALGEEYFGGRLGALAGGVGAAAAAVMLVPLHHRINHWAEQRFRRQLENLRRNLPLLVGDLRETAGLDRIAAAVLDAVTQGVRASRVAMIVGDEVKGARNIPAEQVEEWRADWTPAPSEGLDCRRGDALFPLRIPLDADGHGRVGWLVLGPRPDGSFYGSDERSALKEIADSIARAVGVVRSRDNRETELQNLLANFSDRIAETLRRLAALEGDNRAPLGRAADFGCDSPVAASSAPDRHLG